jgi:hypothetical protein
VRVQLAQQAKAILGQSDLVMITERVDDVALLIGQMVKMGFVEVLDRHLPRHWKQRRLSWGWTAVIWLAYILTEGDHRKVTVAAYIKLPIRSINFHYSVFRAVDTETWPSLVDTGSPAAAPIRASANAGFPPQ